MMIRYLTVKSCLLARLIDSLLYCFHNIGFPVPLCEVISTHDIIFLQIFRYFIQFINHQVAESGSFGYVDYKMH
jgi:hypothetical protein